VVDEQAFRAQITDGYVDMYRSGVIGVSCSGMAIYRW
jgi:hypothetical protein